MPTTQEDGSIQTQYTGCTLTLLPTKQILRLAPELGLCVAMGTHDAVAGYLPRGRGWGLSLLRSPIERWARFHQPSPWRVK
jgi:hypothetical protein